MQLIFHIRCKSSFD